MNNYCAFSNNHQYLKWNNYQVTRYELEEADELCHCNQLALASLQKRVMQLERLLVEHGIYILHIISIYTLSPFHIPLPNSIKREL